VHLVLILVDQTSVYIILPMANLVLSSESLAELVYTCTEWYVTVA